MGTRGAWGWRINGRDLVKYNQFDSNPEALGVRFLSQALEKSFTEHKRFVEEKIIEVKIIPGSLPDPEPNWQDEAVCFALKTKILDVADEERPGLLKEAGLGEDATDAQLLAKWLPMFSRETKPKEFMGKGAARVPFKPYSDFLLDSLFCEYAYIINLDNGMIEFYRGFNQDPRALGRYGARKKKTEKGSESEYFGVRLYAAVPFERLGALGKADREAAIASVAFLDPERDKDDAEGEKKIMKSKGAKIWRMITEETELKAWLNEVAPNPKGEILVKARI